jgi:hypothetical protein
MRRKKLKNKFGDADCVYCGAQCESSDHVPPKCLFANPAKEDLIEVPSCKKCNNSFSKDDEYLKIVLGILDVNESHTEVQKLQPSINRAFFKPEKKRFVESFLKTMEMIPRYTDSGLYVGHAPAFTANKKRLLKSAERITKGLFYHERKFRLPDEFQAAGTLASDFLVDLGHDVGDAGQSLRRILRQLLSQESKKLGHGVFEYSVAFLDAFEEPNKSAWYLKFYGTIDFLFFTYEKESEPASRIISPYN